MSLNEIAVDLTCDAETFQPASTPPTEQDEHPFPGQFAFPNISEKVIIEDETTDKPSYHVHGGMLKMAKLMGDAGKPVHSAVLDALHHNPDYGLFFLCVRCVYRDLELMMTFPELVLCGHSLGAGVAAILGMVALFALTFDKFNIMLSLTDLG